MTQNIIQDFFNSNFFLKNYFESSPNSMWIADIDGIMRIINNSFKKLWKLNETDVIGKYCLFTDKLLQQLSMTEKLYDVFKNGKTLNYSLVKYDTDRLGNVHPLENIGKTIDVILSPIFNNENKIIGAIIQHYDVTDKFDFLFEASLDAILLADEKGIITNANNAAELLFERKKSELIGQSQTVLHPPEKFNEYKELFRNHIENKISHSLEIQIITKSGRIKYCDISSTVVKFNKVLINQGIFRDITKRKQDENALRESENKYKTLVDNIPQRIFSKDCNSVYLSCNEIFARDFQRTAEEIIGKTDYDLFPKEMADKFRTADTQIIVSGRTIEFEEQYILKDKKRWALTVKTPLKNIDGKTIGILGIFNDITIRKQAEKELSELISFSNQIIESAQDGIIVCDKDLKYLVWNSFMEKITGKLKAEVIGKNPIEVFPFLKEVGIIDRLKKILSGNKSSISEFPFTIQETGKSGWAWALSSPLENTNGEIIGVIDIVRDITEYKKLQEQLIHSERLAAVGQLAAGIAHEFNNILAIVQGHAQLLCVSPNTLPENCLKSIKTIEKVIKRGKNIVLGMMNFSRTKPPHKEYADIVEIIERILEIQKNLFEVEHIKIEKKYEKLEMLSIDIGQIEQVLLNIIINARHAILPKKKGIIQIEIIKNNDYAEIIIADNGIGMNDDIKKKIFTPFFSTKGAYAKNSHKIDGKFIITLPVGKIKAQTKEIITETQNKIVDNSEKKLRFLIIDDEPDILELLKQILEINNCETISCLRGKDSIELVKNNYFNAVFLDLLMPDMDGLEILKEIKRINKKITVILVSGKVELEIDELKKLGAGALIRKPFNLNEIEKMLFQIKSSLIQ